RDFYGSDLIVTQYAGKPGGRFSLASKFVARLLAKRGGLVGFTDSSRWNAVLYDHLVPVRPDIAVADHDRMALRAANIPISIPFPTLRFVEDTGAMSRLQLEEENFIIVHLFSGAKGRGLHPDKKREVLRALAVLLPGAQLVISGGPQDRTEAFDISEGIPATVIAGKATLQELMNLVEKSQLIVSLDTGVAHMAAQLVKPLVVMRTCLGRNWWVPSQYGANAPITVCSHDTPCSAGHVYKDHPPCLNGISVEEVADVVARNSPQLHRS
ncbi:MAG: hypothetical protein G01um101449_406, partial [Parcubacteria group bacterium Gr01-1014_49]